METTIWAIVPSVMLMIGTVIAGYFTLKSNRRKVDSTSSNELALAIMVNQTTRVAALEAAQKVTADVIATLQKENIGLLKRVAEQDIIIQNVEKLEQDKTELVKQLGILFKGTLVNIKQLASLGEIPNYIPASGMEESGDLDLDNYEWISPRDKE